MTVGQINPDTGKIQQNGLLLFLKEKRGAEAHRISCPHCQVGWADIVVDRPGGGIEMSLEETVNCVQCKRAFWLQPKVSVIGTKLSPQERMAR